jgi:hypothetical protein
MKHIAILATLFLSTIYICSSCSQDSEDNLFPPGGCDTTVVSYSAFVAPLIQNQCGSCHSGSAAPFAGAGIVLTGHSAVSNFLNNGSAIFLGAINHEPGFSAMPKSGAKLSDCDRLKLQIWISNGFPDN